MEEYIRQRKIELAQRLEGRHKVYLDLRFWILLRDASLNEHSDWSGRKLLLRLRSAVHAQRIICPVSAAVMIELFKQAYDDRRRIATAKMIDELSLGVSVCTPDVLMACEIYFLFRSRLGEKNLYAVQELIWTKLGFAFGEVYPSLPDLTLPVQNLIQRKVFNRFWHVSCEEFVQVIGDANLPDDPYYSLGAEVNSKNAEHSGEFKTFAQIFDIELRGQLESASEIAADIVGDMISKDVEKRINPTESQRAQTVKQCWNLLYAHLSTNSDAKFDLRYIYAHTVIHAQMRLDKKRKFKPNDFLDFQHGAVAVSYFDAIFTEGSLKHLLTQSNANLTHLNSCTVVSDVQSACEHIEKLMI